MARQHYAGSSVSSGIRESVTDVYEQTRQMLLDALQHPDTTAAEKEALNVQLDELRTGLSGAENHQTVKGLRLGKRKKTEANRVFRAFESDVQKIADNVMIAFAHLLGNEEDVTPRAAVTAGGPGSKSSGAGASGDGELKSGPESLAMFRQSPEEFSSYYRALSPEDRQLATMSLQEEMQSQNQLFSLISNLQQADHQTGRAIVSNIRV